MFIHMRVRTPTVFNIYLFRISRDLRYYIKSLNFTMPGMVVFLCSPSTQKFETGEL